MANFYPLATDLRNWLLRQGQLRFLSPKNSPFNNPYTFDGSILAIAFAGIVNDCVAFYESHEDIQPFDAEIKCIRLHTEYALYRARICEAYIKQLLFCTSFDEGSYRGSALGSLLSKDCPGCQNSKEKRHKISLLGSLAHKYHLCHTYEGCLNKHVSDVNSLRDREAAHSGVTKFAQRLDGKSVSQIRKLFDKETHKMGDDFVHMLRHISEIEQAMLSELNPRIIAEAQRVCPVVITAKCPVIIAAQKK